MMRCWWSAASGSREWFMIQGTSTAHVSKYHGSNFSGPALGSHLLAASWGPVMRVASGRHSLNRKRSKKHVCTIYLG